MCPNRANTDEEMRLYRWEPHGADGHTLLQPASTHCKLDGLIQRRLRGTWFCYRGESETQTCIASWPKSPLCEDPLAFTTTFLERVVQLPAFLRDTVNSAFRTLESISRCKSAGSSSTNKAIFAQAPEPPSGTADDAAIQLLESIGALTQDEEITSLGRNFWLHCLDTRPKARCFYWEGV
jgi:hypothetical protein